jgi:hypothetical protein
MVPGHDSEFSLGSGRNLLTFYLEENGGFQSAGGFSIFYLVHGRVMSFVID